MTDYPDLLGKKFRLEIEKDYFSILLSSLTWKAETIKIFGKTFLTPRLTAFAGEEGITYSYSGVIHTPEPFTDELLEIKTIVEQLTGCEFNVVLGNYYRSGNDSMGWHSDDEPELGTAPQIASVSFGGARMMQFRRKNESRKCGEILLCNNDVLYMYADHQHRFQHQIPKSAKYTQPRINLTFRKILT